MHPGSIPTPGSTAYIEMMGWGSSIKKKETLELPAATFLWLTARNAEFLSGRYVFYLKSLYMYAA